MQPQSKEQIHNIWWRKSFGPASMTAAIGKRSALLCQVSEQMCPGSSDCTIYKVSALGFVWDNYESVGSGHFREENISGRV